MEDQIHSHPGEVTGELEGHHGGSTKKSVIRVTIILTIITLIEIFWGMKISHHITDAGFKWVNAIFFLFFTFLKAGFIVAEFMHLKYEVKNLILSICIPLLLFVWFVIAFCWDGNSWLDLKDRYNGKSPTEAVPAPAGQHHE